MYTAHDTGGAPCFPARTSEMRSVVVLEPRLNTGAGGGSPQASPGWRPDQPSAMAGPGCSEVEVRERPGSVNRPSKRPGKVRTTTGQGVLAPLTGVQVTGHRAQPERPAPPPNPRAERPAARLMCVAPRSEQMRGHYEWPIGAAQTSRGRRRRPQEGRGGRASSRRPPVSTKNAGKSRRQGRIRTISPLRARDSDPK